MMLKIEKALNSLYRKIEGVSGRFGAYRTAEEQSAIDAGKADAGVSYTKAESDARYGKLSDEYATKSDVQGEAAARIVADAALQRSIDFLYKLSEGVLWDIEQREEEGHAQLPKGGVYGNIDDVRGKTEQDSTNGYNKARIKVYPTKAAYSPLITATFDDDVVAGEYITISFDANDNGGTVYTNEDLINWSTTKFNGLRKVIANTVKNGKTITAGREITLIKTQTAADDKYLPTNIMVEIGSTVHDYEPYTGGIPSPNPEYPQEIVSVDSFTVRRTDADGNTLDERTITPPRPLNAIGEYKDVCDVVRGEWAYNTKRFVTSETESTSAVGGVIQIATNDKWDADTYLYRAFPAFFENATFTNMKTARVVTISDAGWQGMSRIQIVNTVSDDAQKVREAYLGKIAVVPLPNEQVEPISAEDLDFLRNLTLLPGETLIVTDNHGRDVSYLMSDFINLKKAVEQ